MDVKGGGALKQKYRSDDFHFFKPLKTTPNESKKKTQQVLVLLQRAF
jgi:hypothetical protein